ncbi:helix-turn-helix transcriptional regulator [Lysinibacter sp. HNR]|uniref:helix-turn-helix domain-containing protein n=1 Tax=Lysinibacter sp. HNR TaxID=3031408 RepID=UPI002435CD81|nr:helix-turn-helix transcriptional regulator [Lysinibacter sp. HNR]WGD38187.1 helix-turn-helix transcriptional regulator [Lysinibacter sp. HNR]
MNESRIVQLRQERGWTQEKLATESGVGVRTVQRLESGNDASLETPSLIAKAFKVTVRELFVTIDNTSFNERVESLEARAKVQQVVRDRTNAAWRWLFIGVGIAVSFVSFSLSGAWGATLFLMYWAGGTLIFLALHQLIIEPHLNEKFSSVPE